MTLLDGSAPRSIHVIAGLRRADGGPTYSVPRLCDELRTRGHTVRILSVAGRHDDIDRNIRAEWFAQSFERIPVFGSLRHSQELYARLLTDVGSATVLHVHGVWLLPNVYPGWIAARRRSPLIIAPRGMLAPPALRFSKLKKKIFWHLLQRSVFRRADCIHATSEQEYLELRQFGIPNPIAVIPNGVDIPIRSNVERNGAENERIFVSLGRLHAKKGLDRLIIAWSRVCRDFPNAKLKIVGSSERGYAETLHALVAATRAERVEISGPLEGAAKEDLLRAGHVFVLPTLNENFGLVVAEALAAGLPVISTKGAPWSGLIAHDCGWWIDHGVDPLEAALRDALTRPSIALTAMGARGRSWVVRDFSWRSVASQMDELYRWTLKQSSQPPPFVQFQ